MLKIRRSEAEGDGAPKGLGGTDPRKGICSITARSLRMTDAVRRHSSSISISLLSMPTHPPTSPGLFYFSRTRNKPSQSRSLLFPLRHPLPPLPPPNLHIALRQPATRLHQLYDIDDLFARTDGRAQSRQDPGDRAIHLVCSCCFQRAGAPGVEEEGAWDGVGRVAGLGGGGEGGRVVGIVVGGGGVEEGRGE